MKRPNHASSRPPDRVFGCRRPWFFGVSVQVRRHCKARRWLSHRPFNRQKRQSQTVWIRIRVIRVGSSTGWFGCLSPVKQEGLQPLYCFQLLWRKLHRFHDRYGFPIEHLPRIPNEGRMKEALCRALFGKGFDSGLSGGFAPHESWSVRRICNCRIESMRL